MPSISHYILQADAQAHGYLRKLDHPREIGQVEAPLFKLGGLAIGNGWTGEAVCGLALLSSA